MRINRKSLGVSIVLATLALSQGAAASSIAAPTSVETISFDAPSLTIEYGEYWQFALTADYNYPSYNPPVIEQTGTPSGYLPTLALFNTPGGMKGSLAAPYEAPPLNAGTYTFSVTGTGMDAADNEYTDTTAMPATLTITKAALAVESRMVADPTNGGAAIVTARFTGHFVDQYVSSYFPSAGLSPAGEWHLTVLDADGEVATERTVERAAGDDVLATSFVWLDAEPDEDYTLKTEFTPSGPSASNFTISAATDFPYTAPGGQRPVPTSTATAQPDASLPEPTGFGLPLWLVIGVAAVIVGLAALVTVLSVRLSRRSTSTTKDVAA